MDFAASELREAAISDEEMTPLPPTAGGAFASGAPDPGPLVDSPVVPKTTDPGSWQPANGAAGNGSDDAELVETEDHQIVGQAAPSTHSTEATPSRPDDDDPPSGHS